MIATIGVKSFSDKDSINLSHLSKKIRVYEKNNKIGDISSKTFGWPPGENI